MCLFMFLTLYLYNSIIMELLLFIILMLSSNEGRGWNKFFCKKKGLHAKPLWLTILFRLINLRYNYGIHMCVRLFS